MQPYYEHNNVIIYQADCLDVMPLLPDQSIDAIIADIPYGTTACSWDVVIPFEPMWREIKRLIKPNSPIVLFSAQPFTSLLVASNLTWFKYQWVWEKTNAGDFMLAKYRPRMMHEDICVFSKGKHTYNPQMVRGQPYIDKPRKRSHNVVNSTMPKLGIVNEGWRYPSSVQKFSNGNNGNIHPTQKPLDLMQYLIRTYSNPGDLILDFTMGSGTTIEAARNEGRRVIGIERDTDENGNCLGYCEYAVNRLQQQVLPLFA